MSKLNHRRILRIGNKLIEGPSAIFRISDGDWLEKDLHLSFFDPRSGELSSCSIWSDDSMNKTKNFLSPMIRVLKWNRREDLHDLRQNSERTFPMVEIRLGLIKSNKLSQVNAEFLALQSTIATNNDYVPYQIPMERDAADLEIGYEKDYLDYAVYFRNGEQSLSFHSSGNNTSRVLNQLLQMKNLLQESIAEVDKSAWKERYYELTEEYLEGQIPEWYYEEKLR